MELVVLRFSPRSASLSSVTDEVLPQDDLDTTPRNQPRGISFSDPFATNTGQGQLSTRLHITIFHIRLSLKQIFKWGRITIGFNWVFKFLT